MLRNIKFIFKCLTLLIDILSFFFVNVSAWFIFCAFCSLLVDSEHLSKILFKVSQIFDWGLVLLNNIYISVHQQENISYNSCMQRTSVNVIEL